MTWEEGEVYVCPLPDCGCEVTVTKGPGAGEEETQPPTCARGHKMVKKGDAASA